MGPPVETSAASEFRFYEELNDFLPPAARKQTFSYRFRGVPAIKDVIEAIGVPHTEVDLILVDGESVRFSHRLHGGERVAVYPTFERLDITPLIRLRPAPLRIPKFIADVHLGTLARYLRLLGFDTHYDNRLDDRTLVRLSVAERRILLTRDVALLKHKALTHAYFVRDTRPEGQLREVVKALDLNGKVKPFSRCMTCNGKLRKVARRSIAAVVPSGLLATTQRFARCNDCRRVYWEGSHAQALSRIIADSQDISCRRSPGPTNDRHHGCEDRFRGPQPLSWPSEPKPTQPPSPSVWTHPLEWPAGKAPFHHARRSRE